MFAKSFIGFLITLSFSSSYSLETVPEVDVPLFLGRWYQISRNPLPFEPLDCACAQQTLSLGADSNVDVYNSCNIGGPEGPITDISGKAFSLDPVGNTKFLVDFNLPVKGQYWIIALANDYSWAVVSDPSLRSLYILSKTPILDPASYAQAISEAAKQMSIQNLVLTKHENCTYPE